MATWIGFGHGSAQQDPADRDDPNLQDVDEQYPHLYDLKYAWQQGITVTTEWAHNNGNGLGSTRSLLLDQSLGGGHAEEVRGVGFGLGTGPVGTFEPYEIRLWGKAQSHKLPALGTGWYCYLRGPFEGDLFATITITEDVLTLDGPGASDTGGVVLDGDVEIRIVICVDVAGYVQVYVRHPGEAEVLVAEILDDLVTGLGDGLGCVYFEQGAHTLDDAGVSRFFFGALTAAPLGTLDPELTYYVHPLSPVADDTVQSTPSSGGLVYAMLDEDGESVSTADYTTLDEGEADLLRAETLPPCDVHGVGGIVRCRSTTTHTYLLDLSAELDGVTVYGSDTCVGPPSSEPYRSVAREFSVAPDGAAWTQDRVNRARFGYRATSTPGAADLRAAWFGLEVLVSESSGSVTIPEDALTYHASLC